MGLTRPTRVARPTRRSRGGRRRGLRLLAVVTATLLALTGCSIFNEGAEEPADGEAITVRLTNFPQLDPQSVTFGMWTVQMGMLEGLVLQTPDGTDVRPAVAESWEVSDDLLTYTFILREGVTWSNGDPLVADDFVWTYERLMNPERGQGGVTTGASSYKTTTGIKNAAEYNTGTIEDFSEVGVTAVDERTLEFELAAPNPGFLIALTHPSMLPLNPTAVGADDSWEEAANWVGNGPYNLAAWTRNSAMVLQKNPEYWDVDNVAIETVNVQLIEQGSISTTVEFENGTVDIMALGNPGDVTRFLNDPELSEQLKSLENLSTTYLAPIPSRNTVLDDPQVVRALSLGIGRERVAGVNETAEPASTVLSEAVPGWDESIAADQPMWGEEAVAEAQDLLAEAGYPGGEGFPEMTILAGADFPEIDAVIDTWQTNLGISVTKDVVEVGVYVEKRAEVHDEDYFGFWWGSYSGIFTWSNQVEALWSPQQMQTWSLDGEESAEYLEISESGTVAEADAFLVENGEPKTVEMGELVEQATQTTGQEQIDLYKQAATAREESYTTLPLYSSTQLVAAQPRVEGLSLRPSADRYYLKDLSVSGS